MAPVEPVPTRQPVSPKRPPSRVTTTASGWARAASSAADQPPSTATAAPSSASRRASTSARRGPHVGAHRLAHRRRDRRDPRRAERQHGAAEGAVAVGAVVERGDGSPRRVDAVDHHRSERLTGRRLDGGLPAGVDVDEVEQGADDAADRGEALGAGARAGLVEGQAQGLGARGPGVAVAVGGTEGGLGVGDLRLGLDAVLLGRLQPLDQRRLRRLGLRGLGAQALGLGVEASELVVERGQPCPHAGELHLAPLDAGTQGGQLAARLGSAARGCGDALGPLLLVGGTGVGERGLGACQLLGLRGERLDLLVGVGELGGEAGGVGLERGDDGLVDEGAPLAVDAAPALGEHGGEAPRLLAQRLEAHERVAEVVAADVAKLALGGEHRGVELGEGAAEQVLLGGELGAGGAAVGEAAVERGELAAGEEQVQRAQLGHEVAVAAGGVGLALQGSELAADLAEQVAQAGEVALGGGEAALGLLLALAVLEDAGRLIEDQAALFGAGVEHGVDLALAHDHVLLAAHAGVGEQLLDVEQPAGHAVDGVLAVARSEERAGERDLGEVDRQQPGGVVDRERHLGAPERRALGGAGEDDVVHLLRAHRRRGLGTEHPADGVDHVGLAAPVGPHDDGDAGFQVERGGVGEGLEALHGERLEEHPRPTLVAPRGTAAHPPRRRSRVGCGPSVLAA